MAAEDFDAVVADAGSGGSSFAMDTFLDLSGDTRVMPFTALVIPDGTGYARITTSNKLPVIGPLTDAELRASAVPVSAASLPLPSGAATSANQTTIIASLSTIDGHVDGVEALLTSIFSTGIPITGTVTVGTHAVTQSGTWTVQPGNTANTTAWLVTGTGGTFPVTGTFWQATQPVSFTTVPADPFGVNADAASATGSISAKLRFIASTGIPITGIVTVGSHAVTNAGTFVVQENGAALTSLQLIDDVIFTDDAAFTPATSKVAAIGLQADETATDSVDEGDIGCPRMTLDRKQIVTDLPHTAGGLTMSKTVSAATTNATSVKASAGQLYEIFVSNVNAAARYLKLYDKASAPTVGSDTPVWTVIIPGNTAGGGTAKSIPKGLAFTAGIAFALTTEATDAGTTAVAANEIVVNLGYK